jgi:phenylalanyl-tRNA synthetase beta chain
MRAVTTTDATVRGIHQPMRVAGLAYGDADGCNGRAKAGADFYDVKGDVEALLSPLQAEFRPADIPPCIPGAVPHLVGRPTVGVVGEIAPALAPEAGNSRMRRVLFELDLDAVCSAGSRLSSRCPSSSRPSATSR